jgi:predicted component of type VI protein secretion system
MTATNTLTIPQISDQMLIEEILRMIILFESRLRRLEKTIDRLKSKTTLSFKTIAMLALSAASGMAFYKLLWGLDL